MNNNPKNAAVEYAILFESPSLLEINIIKTEADKIK